KSLSRHFWPESNSVIADFLAEVLECPDKLKEGELLSCIKATGKNTFSIKLRQAYPPFLNVLATLGYCVYKIDPKGNFFGSGPFTLKSLNDKNWVLERHDSKVLPFNVPTAINLIKYNTIEDLQLLLDQHKLDVVIGLT